MATKPQGNTPGAAVTSVTQNPTESALAGYKAQRSELNSQLVSLTIRRDLLNQQLRNATGGDAARLRTQLNDVAARTDKVVKSMGDIDDAVNKLLANAPVVASDLPALPAIPAVPGFTTIPSEFPPAPSALPRIGLFAGVGFVVLLVAMWQFTRRRVAPLAPVDQARLEKLQQSVDTIAIEVERISESQRYLSKVIADRTLGAGSAQPVKVGQGDAESAGARPGDAGRKRS